MTYGINTTNTVATTANVSTAEGNASKVATNCIFEVSNSGIWLTPFNNKPNNNGEAISTTTGIHINNSGMNVYKNGTSVAFYGDYARIGSDTGVAFNINSNSLEAYYMNGTTRTRYFQVTPTSMTYGAMAVASQGYADNAAWSVTVSVNTIDYTEDEATLVATVYQYGTKQTSGFILQWYKNAVGTAHGGTVSGTGNNTLTVTDLNASYIAVLQ